MCAKIVENIEGEELKRHQKLFNTYNKGAIRILPQRCFMPRCFMEGTHIIYDLKPRDDDVYIVTYPKCGTTWMQEIVWTMRNNPNLDHPKAHLGINTRCPFIESDYLSELDDWLPYLEKDCALVKEFLEMCPNGDYQSPMGIQLVDFCTYPRTLKSHLPLSLLNPKILKQSKVVYIARNPKDTCVSYYHHNRMFAEVEYKGTLEEFVNLFISGDIKYGPYNKHIEEVWKLKDSDNIHFVFYEDLKKDAEKEIRRLNAFLETHLTDKQIENSLNYTSFSEMKKRDSAFISNDLKRNLQFFVKDVVEKEGGFFRKGEVGDFKDRLTPDLETKLDKWIEETFTKLGIQFSYHSRI